MTTSITTAVQVRSWIYWCAHAGCSNCLRTTPGAPPRSFCAEHAPYREMVALVAAPEFQLDQILAWCSRRPSGVV